MSDLEDAGPIERYHLNMSGTYDFVITKDGFSYVREMERRGEAMERLEDDTLSYLRSGSFRSNHREAYRLWSEAEELLRGDDSQQQLTTIGHKLREAAQTFATELVEYYGPEASPNPADTVNRVRAVVSQHKDDLGEKLAATLEALVHLWGTVNDLIQRQEHGHQKANEPLSHEDVRRAVFLLAIVMYEIDRALAFTRPPPVLGG